MRLTAILAIAVAAEVRIQAGENKKQKVMVNVQNDANISDQATNRAEELATALFSRTRAMRLFHLFRSKNFLIRSTHSAASTPSTTSTR